MTRSRLLFLCDLGWHHAGANVHWNRGFYFTRCRRCGTDLVRASYGGWRVPQGYKIVWRVEPLDEMAPMMIEAAAQEMAAPQEPTAQATQAPIEQEETQMKEEAAPAPVDGGMQSIEAAEPEEPSEPEPDAPIEPEAPTEPEEPIEPEEPVEPENPVELEIAEPEFAEPESAETETAETESAETEIEPETAEAADEPEAAEREADEVLPPLPTSGIRRGSRIPDFMNDGSDDNFFPPIVARPRRLNGAGLPGGTPASDLAAEAPPVDSVAKNALPAEREEVEERPRPVA